MENQTLYDQNLLPQYFTLRVTDGYPLFMETKIRGMLLAGIQSISATETDIFAFVIMPNHVHFIARHKNIKSVVKHFQQEVATNIMMYLLSSSRNRIIQHLDELTNETVAVAPNKIWESPIGSTPIHNENQMTKYIWMTHQNPVRAGIVEQAKNWRWSSCKLATNTPEPLNMKDILVRV